MRKGMIASVADLQRKSLVRLDLPGRGECLGRSRPGRSAALDGVEGRRGTLAPHASHAYGNAANPELELEAGFGEGIRQKGFLGGASTEQGRGQHFKHIPFLGGVGGALDSPITCKVSSTVSFLLLPLPKGSIFLEWLRR